MGSSTDARTVCAACLGDHRCADMTSICTLLAENAAQLPDKPLFVFPETRWRSDAALTCAELAGRAGAAARVVAEAARPGDRALLLFSVGPEFWEAFFACLAAGVIAVPLKTPNLNRASESLERVVRDCAPALLITDAATAELLRKRTDCHSYLERVSVVTPALWRNERRDLAPPAGPVKLAYLQYTSGSTSHPKGVQISHANLLANLALIRDRMELRIGEDSTVTWLPHYHDMGLVGSYLGALYCRLTAWCLPPEEFALNPHRWLQLISRHGATIGGGPTFGFRTCAERIRDEHLAGVNLRHWRVAFVGAERIQPEVLQRFCERFAPCGFRKESLFPCYGLGEATLMVAGGPAAAPPVVRDASRTALWRNELCAPLNDVDRVCLAGCGQVADGCAVAVCDPETGEPLPNERIGEVWVAGPSVTDGYYRRDDLNRNLLRDLPLDGVSRRWLRTGDLGFLCQGELFITGRMKEMMIIRGRNLYPEDLESVAESADVAIAAGRVVAFSIDLDGQESLVIAAELRRSAAQLEAPEVVVRAIRSRIVGACGVNPSDIVLLAPATIPTTTSGKLQRLVVRDLYQTGQLSCRYRERLAGLGAGSDG